MKYLLLCLLASSLMYSTGCSAADRDFDSVVAGVEHRYSVHAQRIPLMGFVSLCARLKTHGGVNGMRVAEFDNLPRTGGVDLFLLVQSRLGGQWQPFVREREQGSGNGDGDQSVIFVRPEGPSMRMMIADYDHGELDLVGMEVHGAALAKWMRDPEEQGRSSRHENSTGD